MSDQDKDKGKKSEQERQREDKDKDKKATAQKTEKGSEPGDQPKRKKKNNDSCFSKRRKCLHERD